MDINEMKANWQKSGQKEKNQVELQKMMRIGNHPVLKRIRIKIGIEVVLLLAFLMVYQDIFDGGNKSFLSNFLLVGSAILFIIADITGYFLLKNPIQDSAILKSLKKLLFRLRYSAYASVVTSLFFNLALIFFFVSGIELTTKKLLILTGIFLSLLVFMILSALVWRQRIAQINKEVSDFENGLTL